MSLRLIAMGSGIVVQASEPRVGCVGHRVEG